MGVSLWVTLAYSQAQNLKQSTHGPIGLWALRPHGHSVVTDALATTWPGTTASSKWPQDQRPTGSDGVLA